MIKSAPFLELILFPSFVTLWDVSWARNDTMSISCSSTSAIVTYIIFSLGWVAKSKLMFWSSFSWIDTLILIVWKFCVWKKRIKQIGSMSNMSAEKMFMTERKNLSTAFVTKNESKMARSMKERSKIIRMRAIIARSRLNSELLFSSVSCCLPNK